MQDELLWVAAAAAFVAAIAILAERRRSRRADLDAVGFMPWTLIQLFAIGAAIVCAALAAVG